MSFQAQLNFSLANYQCATITLIPDLFPPIAATPDAVNPGRFCYWVPTGYNGGATVSITKPNCTPINHRLTDVNGVVIPIPQAGAVEIAAETLNPSRPPIPSRESVLGVNLSFMGGLVVPSAKFGNMPWWDSAFSWCDPATRAQAYALKKAAKETHCILEVPSGASLYSEPLPNFYNPDTFGPLDWTNGLTDLTASFDNLLEEMIDNDFNVIIEMDENFNISLQVVQLVAKRLLDLQLTGFCVVFPGYDGIFYGWSPAQIQQWAAVARSINPGIMLGIEFNPGHIPLGNGEADYQLGGAMQDFDLVAAEANWPADDTSWQIIPRCYRPYFRPPNQPSGDDPNPPFYLIDSPRGPRFFFYMETWWPYNWVRVNANDSNAVAQAQAGILDVRTQVRAMGPVYVG